MEQYIMKGGNPLVGDYKRREECGSGNLSGGDHDG